MAWVVQREALKIDAMMARPPHRRRNQELAGVQLAEGVGGDVHEGELARRAARPMCIIIEKEYPGVGQVQLAGGLLTAGRGLGDENGWTRN